MKNPRLPLSASGFFPQMKCEPVPNDEWSLATYYDFKSVSIRKA